MSNFYSVFVPCVPQTTSSSSRQTAAKKQQNKQLQPPRIDRRCKTLLHHADPLPLPPLLLSATRSQNKHKRAFGSKPKRCWFMFGRLGARIASRVAPASPLFRPAAAFGPRLASSSNAPAQGSSAAPGQGSSAAPTPWAPKHPQLGKSPQEMVRRSFSCRPDASAPHNHLLQINDVPPITVSGDRVSCDGGTDPRLGHPRIYLNLHKGNPVSCTYCGLRCVVMN
jgi:uncharacterized Zn-finger protein